MGRRRHPQLRRHPPGRGRPGVGQEGVQRLLPDPRPQRVDHPAYGRDPAGLPAHRPDPGRNRHRHDPADGRLLRGAAAAQPRRRPPPVLGGRRPHNRRGRRHRRLDLRSGRRHGHRLRRNPDARIHGLVPGLHHLGSGGDVQPPDQRLGRQGTRDPVRHLPRADPGLRVRHVLPVAQGQPPDRRGTLHHVLLPVHPPVRRQAPREGSRLVRLRLHRLPEGARRLRGPVRLPAAPRGLRGRGLLQLRLARAAQGAARLDRLPLRLRARERQAAGRRNPRRRQGGHDVPRRPVDRHRTLQGRLRRPGAGRRGRLDRRRHHHPHDRRHPRREVHRGPVPALLLPRHLLRGQRPEHRRPGQLAQGPPRDPALADLPHGLRRVPLAGRQIPQVRGHGGAYRRRVPRHPRPHRRQAGRRRAERGDPQQLGADALLDGVHRGARPAEQADLLVLRHPGGALRHARQRAVHQLRRRA